MIENSNFTIWTHRGRPEPEHCERAFDIAWMSGIQNFEIDIRKTKDHQVVLTHDADIKRISGVDLKIADLTRVSDTNWRALAATTCMKNS